MPHETEPRPRKHQGGRRKGTSTTRDAILSIAAELFAEHGFEGTTLRAITDRAGVDVAMVSHFFGNKQGLFDEAVLKRGERNIRTLMNAKPEGRSAAHLLEAYFAMWEDPDTAQAVRALFRAALESEENRARLQALMSQQLDGAIRMLAVGRSLPLGLAGNPEEATLDTQLIASHLLGIGISRYILRLSPLAETHRNQLIARLVPVIEAYLPTASEVSGGR